MARRGTGSATTKKAATVKAANGKTSKAVAKKPRKTKTSSESQEIVIRGAREHNLRDVSLKLPKNKLIVMTGVSGSGKSSLAFDTLYAEGQRRYVESLSSYARQFLGQMPKPEVDAITGLAPSISIQQKTSGRNPRSTVGTITEIYDYLRVLFARVGTQSCYQCGKPVTAQSVEQIIDTIARYEDGTKFQLLAPIIQGQKGEYRDLFDDLLKQGFVRARVDGEIVQLSEDLKLDRQMRHNIEVIIDRLVAGKTLRARLAESVEQALKLGEGSLLVVAEGQGARDKGQTSRDESRGTRAKQDSTEALDPPPSSLDPSSEQLFSSHYACTDCGISFEPPSPQLFSFNSPQGMCHECNGMGQRFEFVVESLIQDEKKSLWNGCLALLGAIKGIGRWRRHIYKGVGGAIETDLGLKEGSFLKTPWKDLSDEQKRLFLYGMGDRHITYEWGYRGGTWKHGGTFDGFIPELLDGYRKTNNPMRRRQLEKHMRFVKCTRCGGSRLNRQAAAVTLTTASEAYLNGSAANSRTAGSKKKKKGSRKDQRPATLNISEVCALDIQSAWQFFESLDLSETQQYIAGEALKEIRGRSGFLLRCGLNYLTLERTAPTLSGGESQRIRLAGQIGCGLVDVVYILDEPSIGLHPRDNKMLLDSLCDLRDQGNTVIVVEHDEETMEAADHIVDFGPGPGVRGGEIVVEGSVNDVKKSKKSVTGQFLSGRRKIEVPTERRPGNGQLITINGATHHNLQNVDVEFPLGCFICVTGASGSGKSSLVNDILWQTLNRDINKGKGQPGDHESVTGIENVDKAIDIDQSPIGRTPRSNPATYVKLFDLIRDLYAKLPEAKIRGYKPGRFSFNVSGGRCEACEGHGANKLEMDFLADIWVTCPVCNAQRFHHETLEVRFKGKNIAEVLNMDVQEALEHFENVPKIHRLLQTLHDVGLDYLKLGQPSPTLSGGEAQRIKLARELGKRSTGQTIYLLDEPTTGLHFADVEKLLEVLHGFVENGNTVLVVEHSVDVIKTADWVIDVGPEGGSGGGTVVCAGTPEAVAANLDSHTGTALAPVLGIKRRAKRGSKSAEEDALRWQKDTSRLSSQNAPRAVTVRGASQHNLQNIDVDIPRDRMNVFCGPSGSGKTSLAMDTLYAEGQRRYVESLSAYARQFLGQMPKPRVEHIHGLQPSIAIEQKSVGSTPRSTVGTVTEIYDYLRILWCRLGTQHCPACQTPVNTQTTDEVIERLLSLEEGTKLLLLAPQEIRVGQAYERLWDNLREQGYARVRIDGTTHRLEDVPEIDRKRKHNVEVVVDRINVKSRQRSRIADSVEIALGLGQGVMRTALVDDNRDETDWKVDSYSLFRACEECGRSFEELIPNNFSFNSPLGWCPECEGLGIQQGTDLNVLLNDPHRSLQDAAVAVWPDPGSSPVFLAMLQAMSKSVGIRLDVPFAQLDPIHRRAVLYGTGDRWFEVEGQAARDNERGQKSKKPTTLDPRPSARFRFQYKGLFPAVEEASRVSYSHRRHLAALVGDIPCSSCDGSRTRDDAANMRFQGKTLQQVCETPLGQALEFLEKIRLTGDDKRVAGDLLEEARGRMSFLVEVGLEYLTLQRTLPTLSGGETQRIRLAGQIGRALTGVLYVLDEPTIGLHPRDNARLLTALHRLRDLGNTMILVEHDREVIASADRVFDFGPGAGRFGGTITEQGTPKQLASRKKSLTGEYLGDKKQILIPEVRRMASKTERKRDGEKEGRAKNKSASPPRRISPSPSLTPPGGGWLELLGARLNNLRDVDLRLPLGTFTVITGVSGSGKSSLVEDTLAKALVKHFHRANEQPGPYDKLKGLGLVNKAIVVDQAPLGSTPKSNPGTYTGVFDHIRELFCRLPDSKVRGYRPGRFSFNRPGGRCDACEGDGQKKIEMHFLPDVWVECDECRGERYNRETLSVKYRGHSIADVLNLSIGQCRELFENIPKIRKTMSTLCAIGLDYLTLGQSATTLSGGEAQRVKLAAELARPNTGKTVYILDEPTTGLHFEDIDKLLKVLNSLVEAGNTVIVIEHNLDVIKTADWVVDLGPEAGIGGGWIVAEGTPEDLVEGLRAKGQGSRAGIEERRSHTAEQLVKILAKGRRGTREVFDAAAEGKKRDGDLTMAQVGKDAKMPWEADGRKWHTRDRIAHSGKPCQWEGDALEMIVEQLTAEASETPPKPAAKTKAIRKKKKAATAALMSGADLLKAQQADQDEAKSDSLSLQSSALSLKTIWNDSSTVEVTGDDKRLGWFMHALTRDEWLLKLYFRVQRGCFEQKELAASLNLRNVDDINELPIYGRSDRVRVKNKPAGYQEVLVTVHWKSEIDTPEFREFLSAARASYIERVEATSTDVKDVAPWKVLGRKWHVMQKGFPAEKRPKWKKEVLETLLEVFDKVIPDGDVVWNERAYVRYRKARSKDDWAVICTKRRVGIDLVVTPKDESVGIGSVATLATEHEAVQAKNGKPAIRLRFDKLTQVKSPKLRDFLKKCL
ncbi:MAG: excinuclease ABC subunit UvrA [Planctomycetales bacterium]